MSLTFSVFRIITVIILFLTVFSCKDKKELGNDGDFSKQDSLIGSITAQDTSINPNPDLDKFISDYSYKHNAVMDFTKYGRMNQSEGVKVLRSKRILIPLFKSQIGLLNLEAKSDTVLTCFGKESNSFVFNVKEGQEKIKKLNAEKNAVILFKPENAEVTQKLYLMKKHNEFQHKEKKVTEFYLTGEIEEVFNVDGSETKLRNIFNLEQN